MYCAVTREYDGGALASRFLNAMRRATVGKYISRPICLFKLHEPVCVEHWRFSVNELQWPGKTLSTRRGGSILIVLPGRQETLNARALALLSG
ncbi:VOC family protein [Salmonella enterica subsp. enterica]|nr:VOC family protein [Salmonella enterica subsp. enterica]